MLEDKKYMVRLKCVFCKSELFELPSKNYHPEEGEMIRCSNCGRLNDFSSIKNLEINPIFEKIKNDVQDEIKKLLKKNKLKSK